MKVIVTVLFILFAYIADAQVKFELENVKDKSELIVYSGTVNTFSINLPNDVRIKNISASSGNVQMTNAHTFVLYVQTLQDAPVQFQYTLIKNGVETQEIYPVKYTIKQLPDYFRLRIGPYAESGKVSLQKILKNHQIAFNDVGYNGDLSNMSITFDLMLTTKKGKVSNIKNLTNKSQTDLNTFDKIIISLKKGDRLSFINIKAVLDNSTSRNMENLSLEVQ